MKKRIGFVKQLVWFTQLGLSIAAPLVICIVGSVWIRDRFAVGGWIVALGVLLGLGAAVSTLWSTLKAMDRAAREDDRDSGVGFNEHK